MVSPNPIKVLSVVGPTASQKSLLALRLAKLFNGEIINADSRQFYVEMNIGTAKPSQDELNDVPHHLIDCAHLGDAWDVARFTKRAHECIADIDARGRLPIVVGGTGLYVRALLWGLDEIPPIPYDLRLTLAEELKYKGLHVLYEKLSRLDPEGADRILPHDTQRILRALEVVMHTQKPLHSFWQDNKVSPYKNLRLAIDWPRDVLYQSIDVRVLQMIQNGLKAEAQDLSLRFPNDTVLHKTIGYQEWLKCGFDHDAKVIHMIQQNTRQFAKRQLTWSRKETDVVWLQPQNKEEALKIVAEFLK